MHVFCNIFLELDTINRWCSKNIFRGPLNTYEMYVVNLTSGILFETRYRNGS